MHYTLSYIAKAIGVEFKGEDIKIEGIHTLSDASASQLSFFTDSKYISELSQTKAAAVLIDAKHAPLLPSTTIALISDEAYLKLAEASKFFAHSLSIDSQKPTLGECCEIAQSVSFGKNVILGNHIMIMAGCYIGDDVTIDSGTLLYPNTTLYHHTQIGKDCIIHSGTVIGCDGYGFAHTKQGAHIKIHQNGIVVIEDDVEIGANCSIDRAVFGVTWIRKGTKLDNLVHIAHNCDLGEHTLLAGQVGLAGSTTLGRNVIMGGQSASAGHLRIGDFTTIAGKSGVTKSLAGSQTYAGFPAIEHRLWLKIQAKISRLIKKM
ncbi:MAG: UDP-3-O-(3-hydroxymyristoyl)glucosamine N-acyltransferase [Sulfurovum sp.]|nr:UDP-3-O-(3-hydroxymyristoyl)glucosamine N-acyltransferase [Sulfurovum sp.]